MEELQTIVSIMTVSTSSYSCKQSLTCSSHNVGYPMEPSAMLEPGTKHLEMKDAVNQELKQLAVVPIHYSDLAGVDCEPITLFADNTTTAL